MKKTDWFSPGTKPVRKGWYEVKQCDGNYDCNNMHYWDGAHWMYPGPPFGKLCGGLFWRGLTRKW